MPPYLLIGTCWKAECKKFEEKKWDRFPNWEMETRVWRGALAREKPQT
jgi:hypothetical protein